METVMTEFAEFVMTRLDLDSEEEAIQFVSDLEDHGIETEEQFDNSYMDFYGNSHYPEREFAKNLYIEMEKISRGHPLYNFIDWQGVWDHELRYDYHNINGYFFRNI